MKHKTRIPKHMMKSMIVSALLLTSMIALGQLPSYTIRSPELCAFLSENPTEDYSDRSECFGDFEEGSRSSMSCSDAFGTYSIEVLKGATKAQFVYSSGHVKLTMNLNEHGELVGPKTVYFRDSLLVFSIWEYSKGRIENVQFYNRKGEELASGDYAEGSGKLILYRQDGTVSLIAEYQNYRLEGKCTMYYSNGAKMIEGRCEFGKPVGQWKEWSFEGKRLL